MPTVKRPKPEKTPSLEHKLSPVMDEFPYSPTPTTSSDVRLENFVTQSCEVSNQSTTNLISPLGANGRFAPASTEVCLILNVKIFIVCEHSHLNNTFYKKNHTHF